MRFKYLSRLPNKPGHREIRITDDPLGFDFSRSGKIYSLYVNGNYIARHDDFMDAMKHLKNTIYGYDKEIIEY
jgi:hypothetical protein